MERNNYGIAQPVATELTVPASVGVMSTSINVPLTADVQKPLFLAAIIPRVSQIASTIQASDPVHHLLLSKSRFKSHPKLRSENNTS